MKISIIIPTLSRPEELSLCLSSIKHNTRQPDEIIVVEQGNAEVTKELAGDSGLNVQVKHLDIKSLTVARNTGLKHVTGDVVVFIDDDVVIAADYLQLVEDYFIDSNSAAVLGIIGQDLVYAQREKSIPDFLRQAFGVLFWRSTFGNRSRVLLSGHNVMRNTADEEQSIQWVSGATNAWRKEVFAQVVFDERMIRWSFSEDVSFSHQVQSLFPDSLRYVPSLKYRHNVSDNNRLPNQQLMRMMVIYRYIFWREQIKTKSRLSTLAYLWSQVGFVILTGLEYRSVDITKILFRSYHYVYRNRNDILSGSVAYNDYILGKIHG